MGEDGRTPADRGREEGVESGSVESRGLCTVQAALGPASGAARLFDRVASCVANVGGGGRGAVGGGARTMARGGRAQSAGGEDPGLLADMTDKWSLHAQSWLLDTARNVGNGLAGLLLLGCPAALSLLAIAIHACVEAKMRPKTYVGAGLLRPAVVQLSDSASRPGPGRALIERTVHAVAADPETPSPIHVPG